MKEQIAERIVIKMRVVNIAKKENEYSNNFRECPFYSELVGMLQLLKTMGVKFDIEYDSTVKYYTAFVIENKRFEV